MIIILGAYSFILIKRKYLWTSIDSSFTYLLINFKCTDSNRSLVEFLHLDSELDCEGLKFLYICLEF